eukprot:scaffold75982_cov65-Phaeocystis_antarctica.AAC.13
MSRVVLRGCGALVLSCSLSRFAFRFRTCTRHAVYFNISRSRGRAHWQSPKSAHSARHPVPEIR